MRSTEVHDSLSHFEASPRPNRVRAYFLWNLVVLLLIA